MCGCARAPRGPHPMEIILNHWQLEGMTSNHTNQFIELAFEYDKNKRVIL